MHAAHSVVAADTAVEPTVVVVVRLAIIGASATGSTIAPEATELAELAADVFRPL